MARNDLLDLDAGGDILGDLEPTVVQVGPPGLPALPALRPKGGPDLPFER